MHRPAGLALLAHDVEAQAAACALKAFIAITGAKRVLEGPAMSSALRAFKLRGSDRSGGYPFMPAIGAYRLACRVRLWPLKRYDTHDITHCAAMATV